MKITDDILPILECLEFSVAQVWRAHPEISDYTALRAYEAAFQHYRAESPGHTPKPSGLTGMDQAAFEGVKEMCEFRLSRGPCPGGRFGSIPPISLELLLDCLRELIRSVERHTKIDGRQGYMTFIDGFVP